MAASTQTAILAGGCFWGMQDLIRRQPGVITTRVGYTGGDVPNATYHNHGTHAEAVEIVFDPTRPATATCWSSSSRSTIRRRRTGRATTSAPATDRRSSTLDDEQRRVAEDTIADVERLRPVAGQGGHRGDPGRSVLGGRARAPGLPAALSQRLHLPLPAAGLEAAATGGRELIPASGGRVSEACRANHDTGAGAACGVTELARCPGKAAA